MLGLYTLHTHKSYSFSDLKHEITLERICFGRSRSCLYRSKSFYL